MVLAETMSILSTFHGCVAFIRFCDNFPWFEFEEIQWWSPVFLILETTVSVQPSFYVKVSLEYGLQSHSKNFSYSY